MHLSKHVKKEHTVAVLVVINKHRGCWAVSLWVGWVTTCNNYCVDKSWNLPGTAEALRKYRLQKDPRQNHGSSALQKHVEAFCQWIQLLESKSYGVLRWSKKVECKTLWTYGELHDTSCSHIGSRQQLYFSSTKTKRYTLKHIWVLKVKGLAWYADDVR